MAAGATGRFSPASWPRFDSAGARYNSSQEMDQIKPMTPVHTNASRQLYRRAIQTTSGGARMGPKLRPVSKAPMATPRCSGLNHSATALTPPGMMAASPMASMARKRQRVLSPTAAPWRTSATDHQITTMAIPRREPRRSSIRPISRYITE